MKVEFVTLIIKKQSLMPANKNRLYNDVEFLTSIRPYRNYKNIESLQIAADYIEKEFRQTDLSVSRQAWKAKGNVYENIIASFQPEKKKRFIVGAHYDVFRDIPGADDNASSVAAILELARLLSTYNAYIPYGIDLVAFCLEEPPFFKTKMMGSYIHAKSVNQNNTEVNGMIALEMIGYYGMLDEKTEDDKYYLFVSGIKKHDDFNKKVSTLLRQGSPMNSRRISFADDYRNNGPSDHRNYWKFNYPAAMIIGSGKGRNPHYHQPTDTIETLDFDVMTEAVNSIRYATFNFSESDIIL